MGEAIVAQILACVLAYLAIGAVVALIYVFGGAGRIDPAAKGRGMPLRVRFMIFPGVMALWPMMALKLFTQTEPPEA